LSCKRTNEQAAVYLFAALFVFWFVLRTSKQPSSFCSSLCLLVCLENQQAAIIFLQLSFVFLFVLQTCQNCFMDMQKSIYLQIAASQKVCYSRGGENPGFTGFREFANKSNNLNMILKSCT